MPSLHSGPSSSESSNRTQTGITFFGTFVQLFSSLPLKTSIIPCAASTATMVRTCDAMRRERRPVPQPISSTSMPASSSLSLASEAHFSAAQGSAPPNGVKSALAHDVGLWVRVPGGVEAGIADAFVHGEKGGGSCHYTTRMVESVIVLDYIFWKVLLCTVPGWEGENM